jgi:hypothetical protein
MLAADRQSDAGRVSPRRPSVRIVGPRRISRNSAITLVLVCLAALAIPAGWRLSRSDEPLRALQRRLEEVELEWKCPLGHVFYAAGQVEPRRCWECDRESYPVTHFACAVHGPVEVLIKYRRTSEGAAEVWQLRPWSGGVWVAAADGVNCPRCGRRLAYRPNDPLEAKRSGKRGG